jgi:hypothetical protein
VQLDATLRRWNSVATRVTRVGSGHEGILSFWCVILVVPRVIAILCTLTVYTAISHPVLAPFVMSLWSSTQQHEKHLVSDPVTAVLDLPDIYLQLNHTSNTQHTTTLNMHCKSKQALLRGLRPRPGQTLNCGDCSRECIFCDIWNLAVHVYTRTPLSHKYETVQPRRQQSARASSPTHRETYDWEASERMIEVQFQQQRVRLASIISICTVEGAEESEGLHVAFDRCLRSVKQLLYQERVLEETLVKSIQSSQRRPSETQYAGTGQYCGSANSDYYYSSQRRPSRVGIAM